MTLGTKMIDLIRLDIIDDIGKLFTIGKITIMKNESYIFIMRILVYLINSSGINGRRTAD